MICLYDCPLECRIVCLNLKIGNCINIKGIITNIIEKNVKKNYILNKIEKNQKKVMYFGKY
jgi:hypothetical protein